MSFYAQFAEHYERVFPFREDVYGFLTAYLPARNGKVLDVGCGPGHYCGRLAIDGVQVLGIDLDGSMIAAARGRYPAASFRQMDMAAIAQLQGPYDLVFCIGNVAAHVEQQVFDRVVQEVYRLLAPQAYWLFQVVNWDFILQARAYKFPHKSLGPGQPTFLREYHEVSENSVRFVTQLNLDDERLFRGETRLYPVRSDVYRQLHEESGFELVGHFGDYHRKAYVPTADSGNIFVFRKVMA